MPNDKFWASYFEMSPDEWQMGQERYFDERFLGTEIRQEAAERMIKLYAGKLPSDMEKEEPLLRVGEFYESVGTPPPMIAAGILSPNTVMLVSAKPKSGKTFLMLQMADDIASGTPLFGKWEVERPGPVIFLAMEGSRYQFRERVEKRGMHKRNPEVYIYHARKDLSTPAGVAWLVNLITPLNPSAVIVDTARQAFKIDDWNNASMVQTRMQPLIESVQKNGPTPFPDGCVCVLVHHNNKNSMAEGGDKISGTNAFQGIVDGYMILDKKKRLANGDLQVEAECEGRIDLPDKITFQMDTETLQVSVLAEEDVEKTKRQNAHEALSKHFDRVMSVINDLNGQATIKDITEGTAYSDSYARKIISGMKADSLIAEVGTRKDERGGPGAVMYGPVPNKSCYSSHSSLKRENNNSPDEDEKSDMVNAFMNDKKAESIEEPDEDF